MTPTDINGNPILRDVRSRNIPGLHGAPEGSVIGGPHSRTVKVTAKRFPDLDPVYVIERDHLTEMRRRAEFARAARRAERKESP
jgi:hypothetical protein